MGSFFGHTLPGTFFIICGIWWTIQTFRRYFQSLQKSSRKHFISSVTFPVFTKRGWIDIEAYVVMIFCSIGLIVELGAATVKNGQLGIGNMQHGTMYFFFGLASFSAVILPKLRVIPRSDDIVYLVLTLAFLTEGLLFKFHLFGRTGVDVLLHTLLVYTIFSSMAITLLELQHRTNVLLPLARAFLTILQGTWFWQAAFVLYPPLSNAWGQNGGGMDMHGGHDDNNMDMPPQEHNRIMLLTCVFTWHMAVILISMFFVSVVLGFYYKMGGGFRNNGLLDKNYVNNPGYGGDYTPVENGVLPEGNDDDDEV